MAGDEQMMRVRLVMWRIFLFLVLVVCFIFFLFLIFIFLVFWCT